MEDESGFKPILKPYQIVGVNFLMFMYRKKIAGGNCLWYNYNQYVLFDCFVARTVDW